MIGAAIRTRSLVALAKGASLFVLGLWVLGSTVYRVFVLGVPDAEVMGVVAFLALAANVVSVLLLMPYREGDANIRSVWLCSRNDAIGNVAVMIAALGVWGTATAGRTSSSPASWRRCSSPRRSRSSGAPGTNIGTRLTRTSTVAETCFASFRRRQPPGRGGLDNRV